MRLRRTIVASAMASLLLGACSSPGNGPGGQGGTSELEVGTAQASEPVAGSSQVVVAIANRGTRDDALVGASTDAAHAVELHVTEIADGRATMRRIERVEIPAGEVVRFRPGELHLMLVVPDEQVRVGSGFELTLRFEHAGERTIPVTVATLLDLAEAELDPVGAP